VVRNAVAKAAVVGVSSPSAEVVAPVMTIDSPRAMMMNKPKRSLKWPVSTCQVSGCRCGRPGTQISTRGAP
jgi:hypothetical protein